MGRSCNVAPLGFRNLSRKEANDSVVIEFDINKQDQTGVNMSPKNCYANPFEPLTCMFLALGCYLCFNDDMFNRDSDNIFKKSGKERSASDTYCKALKKLVESSEARKQFVIGYCREGHFHAHGTRKGAATHVTTATMEPPPMPSILMRGEWSLGKVLDLYWKWSALGDCYLGRCLSGIDPDSEDFATLPPHFKEGMENKHIAEAMQLCFGSIIVAWSGTCAIQSALMLFLASMVYHQKFLLGYIAQNSKHPFQSIPILQRPDLLEELTKLVTLDPVGDVTVLTGVPFRVKQMVKLNAVFKTLQTGIDMILTWSGNLPGIIKATVNDIAEEAGQVTVPFVMELLENQHAQMALTVGTAVKNAVEEATRHMAPRATASIVEPYHAGIQHRLGGVSIGLWREYRGYSVPADFLWPTFSLRRAWDAWLFGIPNNQSTRTVAGVEVVKTSPVRPLRYIVTPEMLPLANRVRKVFADDWKPVLKLMEEATAHLTRGVNEKDMDAAFMESTFNAARDSLNEKYPRLFEQTRNRQWKVSTWSKKVREVNRKRKRQRLLLHTLG